MHLQVLPIGQPGPSVDQSAPVRVAHHRVIGLADPHATGEHGHRSHVRDRAAARAGLHHAAIADDRLYESHWERCYF